MLFCGSYLATAQASKKKGSSRIKPKAEVKLNPTMKLVYVYDALCGWCYGFSPVMTQLAGKYPDVPIEVISGGMVMGDRVGPIGEVAPYIAWAYKDVEKATGVKFGSAFLDGVMKDGKAIFSSWRPSLALTHIKATKPELQLKYAAALQKGVYFYGLPPEEDKLYTTLAKEFQLDEKEFLAAMNDSVLAISTKAEFQKVGQLRVTGFPALFVEKDGKYYRIGAGYAPINEIEANLKRVLNSN